MPILAPSRAVYRGQPGCPCLLVNGFYFCTDGRVACCMYCVSSGPPCTRTPLRARCLCPCFCQVPPLPSCHPPPPRGSDACLGTWGAGFGTCPLLGSRHGADAAPRLSNKRILSQRWMPLFMGLGAGIWLCPRLGRDGGAVRPGGRLRGQVGTRERAPGAGSSRLGPCRARSWSLSEMSLAGSGGASNRP